MGQPVTYGREGDIAVIAVDNPPVNALSTAVRAGLDDAVTRFAGDPDAKVAVLYGTGRTFIAGADIREFGKPPQPPMLIDVIGRIEACGKPIIAALHGTALGGGLEVALGCHYRVAIASGKVGLPEVNLGILPGAGGTQRLPRLTGVEIAAEMITSGRHVGAPEALEAGILDAVADGDDPLQAGLDFARKAIDDELPARRVRDLEDKLAPAREDPSILDAIAQKTAKKARGQLSPVKCVEGVRAAVELPFDEGVKREREIFSELMASPQREALIYAFFGERAVGKIPEAATGKARDLNSAGVIGGGTMGAGITVAMLTAGIPVTMVERDAESAERGRANVTGILEEGVRRGKMAEARKDEIFSDLYRVESDMNALADADLVIEAVFEDLDLKKQIFATLDGICKPGAVMASNTSYLDVDQIAAQTGRPEDVLGLHFFSPAHIMRLVEVVVADKTSADVTMTGFALAKRLRKIAVRAGVCDGFIGNRILSRYLRITGYMVEDGASPYDIDKAVIEFGYPMGPFSMGDLAGLDIGFATRKRKAATRNPNERYASDFVDRICENGWFGRKTGKGYYVYEKGAAPVPNPEVPGIIEAVRAEKGITPRDFSHEEIIRRYLAAMINEAALIVSEKIALRPVDVDMTMLFGYAFPRWRGGPMKYADQVGLDTILADIRAFAEEDAHFWQPAPLLVELAESGRSFGELND